jgi:AraC-like DNA-binding protein
MMSSIKEDYLTLRLVRLRRFEAWLNEGRGFAFVLAKGGQGRYVSRVAAQSLLPRDVLVLNSAEGGKIEVAGDDLVFWRFSVCLEHLFPLFAVEEICSLQDTIENLKGPRLYPASCSLAQECHRLVSSLPPQGGVDHRSQVLTVAAAVLAEEFKNTRGKRVGIARMEDHMTQVFGELSTTELLTLSVEDMARKFHCSRRHLSRLFLQHFGRSVGSMRMEMRLLKALSLLRAPGVKIINVAEQCGFNHLGLFNTCFKKRFGKTPGLWRKAASNGEEPVSKLDEHDPRCPIGVDGLCPWGRKQEGHDAMPRRTTLMQAAGFPGKLANHQIRETLVRNARAVNAAMNCKFSSGSKSQTCP